LNTNFGGIQLNLGRGFSFAFGNKENGAVFSHMTVMYGNALYKRGFVREGYHVLNSLYRLSHDFNTSRIYPGIPEYFNNKGRGMYHYLTGSASWLLLTILTEVFGVKGFQGNLMIEPKLMLEQFDAAGTAKVKTTFRGKTLEISYCNYQHLEYGQYKLAKVSIDNGWENIFSADGNSIIIDYQVIDQLDSGIHRIKVELGQLNS
jgi:cellobiose phosphorylase